MPGAVADAGFCGQALAVSSRVAPSTTRPARQIRGSIARSAAPATCEITHVDDNLRVVRVLCASCQEHSWLAVPPIR